MDTCWVSVGADSEYESSDEEFGKAAVSDSGWFSFLPKTLQNFTGTNDILKEQ